MFTAILFIGFFVMQTLKLYGGKDPFFSMMTMANDDRLIDLYKMDFFFAIEKPDPKMATVKAT